MDRVFVLDPDSGEAIGEVLDLESLRVGGDLDDILACSFTTRVRGAMRRELRAGRLLACFRRNPRLNMWTNIFSGEIATAEASSTAEDRSKAVLAFDPSLIFRYRVVDNEAGDGRLEHGISTPMMERGLLAAELITDSLVIDGNHWVRALPENQAPSPELSIKNWGGFLKLWDAIDQIGPGTVDGFDWKLDFTRGPQLGEDGLVTVTTDEHGLILADWVSSPTLGRDLSGIVTFNHGCGLYNVLEARDVETMETYADRISSVVSGAKVYAITRQDDAQVARRGVREDVITDSGLTDSRLRTGLVNLHLAVRAPGPRRIIEIKPDRSDQTGESQLTLPGLAIERAPIPYIDYDRGDRVDTICVMDEDREDIVAGSVRVYGLEATRNAVAAEYASAKLQMK